MTVEQQARDLLERMEIENAQSFSSGKLIEIVNLINCCNSARRNVEYLTHVFNNLRIDADRYRKLRKSFIVGKGLASVLSEEEFDRIVDENDSY